MPNPGAAMSVPTKVAAPRTPSIANKVPQVTIYFWIIKIMATTVGETGADFLNFNLGIGLTATSVIIGFLLVGTLCFQFNASTYVPWRYWSVVLLISVFGTLITDNLSDNLGVPLEASTVVFTLALTATFLVWYRSERTLSIHAIDTPQREFFYWLAILFTFALGTAAGDLVAEQMALGYLTSAVGFGLVIVTITVCYYLFDANSVLCFWLAYILTRPFGASCGDFLSQPVNKGGLGLGTVGTSAIFIVVIIGLVVLLTLRELKGRQRANA
jgi:uncharacterized membrane-anchored protein